MNDPICGCPITYGGVTIHPIRRHVRVGTPEVFPVSAHDITEARTDALRALGLLAFEAGALEDKEYEVTKTELLAFVEQAKQRLNVLATAAAVLP